MPMPQLSQQKADKRKWLLSYHWTISAIISAIFVVALIIITIFWLLLYKPDLSITLTSIIAMIALLLGFFQWAYPKPDKKTDNAPPSPIAPVALAQTMVQAPTSPQQPTPTLATTPHPALPQPSAPPTKTVSDGSAPSTPKALVAEDIFFFNVPTLPDKNEFYGREDHCRTLLNRTRQRSSTSLIGPRRIGKTWLLQYLRLIAKTRIGLDVRIVSIDATLPSCGTVEGFTTDVIRELRPSLAKTQAPQHGLVALEEVVTSLLNKKYLPVLCIDEFEHFGKHAVFDLNFFTGLRALANMGLVLVIASKHPLIEIVGDIGDTSGFFNIFEQRTLETFTLEEAQTFLAEKGKQAGFTAHEQEVFADYSRLPNGGWPPLRLQLVGKMLLELKGHAATQGEPDWQRFKQRLEKTYRAAVMHDDDI
jgi:AAA domain